METFELWLKRNGYVLWYKQEPLYLKDAEDYSTDTLRERYEQEIVLPYWREWITNKWGYNQQGYVRSSAFELLEAMFS